MGAVPHGAHRIAPLMVRVVDLDVDPRKMALWAARVNMTEHCLRRYCRLAGVHGRDALGLARAIRAVLLSRQLGTPPEELMDIADDETLRRFLRRAGLAGRSLSDIRRMTLDEFLAGQRFVTKPSILAEITELLVSQWGNGHLE